MGGGGVSIPVSTSIYPWIYNCIVLIPQSLTLCHCLDDKPTISELEVIQTVNGNKIKIIKELAPDHVAVGDLLKFDDYGLVVNLIRKNHTTPKECCRAIFQHWMAGCGRRVCSWHALLQIIKDCEKEALAEEIKAWLSHSKA